MAVTTPPIGQAPYDTVQMALNMARTRLNDAMASIGGDILTDTQPFTQTVVTAAWRRQQGFLANKGFSRFKATTVIFNLPVSGNPDPSSRAWIGWSGYWDGANFFPQPVLPQDFISPLKVWERQSGCNMPFPDPPMECILDGITDTPKWVWNRRWEWQQDMILFPGATQVNDLKVLYNAYLPDFIDTDGHAWYEQPIPVMRSADCLASYICYEMAAPRGDVDAESFRTQAEMAAAELFNTDQRMKQRVNIRRRSQSGRLEGAGNRSALLY